MLKRRQLRGAQQVERTEVLEQSCHRTRVQGAVGGGDEVDELPCALAELIGLWMRASAVGFVHLAAMPTGRALLLGMRAPIPCALPALVAATRTRIPRVPGLRRELLSQAGPVLAHVLAGAHVGQRAVQLPIEQAPALVVQLGDAHKVELLELGNGGLDRFPICEQACTAGTLRARVRQRGGMAGCEPGGRSSSTCLGTVHMVRKTFIRRSTNHLPRLHVPRIVAVVVALARLPRLEVSKPRREVLLGEGASKL